MKPCNILVSSAGRRIGLLACIRDSIVKRKSDGQVFTIDSGSSAPATFAAQCLSRVPSCTEAAFVDSVLRLCADHNIGLVVPTIDTELSVYAAASARFLESGATVCVSRPEAVSICGDKIATHQWLLANGFPTVRQTDLQSALLCSTDWPLPLIVKPYNGSASIGVRTVKTRLELEALTASGTKYIVQEIAPGREYTVNVYVSLGGQCVCTVPHWRMEVRAGEVSKGVTCKDHRLMNLARSVAESLPGARGPLNIQCFMEDSGAIRVIEINARFGGGYPLAHNAGARFTDWLLDELEGKPLAYCSDWIDDLAMLRYDEAIFVPGIRIRS